ncbi:MAG: rubrerythrin family protein [Spirochaetaceae bacterium]|nr:rubrerythrin family protein [Spirochaetaceae bacterium]
MKSLQGTKTEQNILKTFAGESQARNRYDYFAKQAEKEGLIQISHIFAETALQEKEHAKRMFKLLQSGAGLEITAMYPAGKIGNTMENLEEAAGGEHEEWSDLYPSFAMTARSEGFEEIAKIWDHIALAEKHHQERYLALLNILKSGGAFKRNGKVTWVCLNCGYLEEASEEAPKSCPACAHPQAYFAVFNEKF